MSSTTHLEPTALIVFAGYIHAIEQRWHQVESLLGVLLQSTDPRVQSVVNDMKNDVLAREILNRVDLGPYVR